MNDQPTPTLTDEPARRASDVHEHLGYLQGDRTCSNCSYNLVHQPIIREPHYNLLIVRCPECGSVTGLNDYPSLGRWARRWAALFAAVLVLLITAMWVGTGGMMFGFGQVATEIGAQNFEDSVDSAFDAYAAQQNAAATAAAAAPPQTPAAPGGNAAGSTEESSDDEADADAEETTDDDASAADESVDGGDGEEESTETDAGDAPASTPTPPNTATTAAVNSAILQLTQGLRVRGGADFQQWWDAADQDALFEQSGGFGAVMTRELFGITLVFSLIFFLVGVIWGIVFIHRKPMFALAWLAAILFIGVIFLSINYAEWSDRSYFYGSWQAARHRIEPLMCIYAVIVALPVILLGMLCGPWVARRIATFLLPPRLLTGLNWLWTARGLTPPSRFTVGYATQPPRSAEGSTSSSSSG